MHFAALALAGLAAVVSTTRAQPSYGAPSWNVTTACDTSTIYLPLSMAATETTTQTQTVSVPTTVTISVPTTVTVSVIINTETSTLSTIGDAIPTTPTKSSSYITSVATSTMASKSSAAKTITSTKVITETVIVSSTGSQTFGHTGEPVEFSTSTMPELTTIRLTSDLTVATTIMQTVTMGRQSLSLSRSFTGLGSAGWNFTSSYGTGSTGMPVPGLSSHPVASGASGTSMSLSINGDSTGDGMGMTRSPATMAPHSKSSSAGRTGDAISAPLSSSMSMPYGGWNSTSVAGDGVPASSTCTSLADYGSGSYFTYSGLVTGNPVGVSSGQTTLVFPTTTMLTAPTTIVLTITMGQESSVLSSYAGWSTDSLPDFSFSPSTTCSQGTNATSSPAITTSIQVTGNPAPRETSSASGYSVVSSSGVSSSKQFGSEFPSHPMPTPTSSVTFESFNRTSSTMATATPTVCGEHGNFTLNWDDEPVFNPDPEEEPDFNFPPVFNPYHHLFFSNGYVYAPPPEVPLTPISPPRLAVFFSNITDEPTSSPNAAGSLPGEIGAGPRSSTDAFWFDAFGAYLSCDNDGPSDCEFVINGYIWDPVAQQQMLATTQNAIVSPCINDQCPLQHVGFSSAFRGLSGIQLQAFVDDEPVVWFMDDLMGAWWNNTCAAGLLRQRSKR